MSSAMTAQATRAVFGRLGRGASNALREARRCLAVRQPDRGLSSDAGEHVVLPADSNQALGLANYAIDFLGSGSPSPAVLARTNLFFTDAMLCATSAIALGTNAPTVLRREALRYPADAAPSGIHGVPLLGSAHKVYPEKAILANCEATREWDSNGTNFGFNPKLGHVAGEFGHPDFFPVAVAAAQAAGGDGAFALRAMVLIEEIRCRLGEVFSLKTYKIDHVVHGAIATAAVYGAALGATPAQIESAIGLVVAHYIPFRAIRAGKQLSDSKGSSSAISSEVAAVAVHRAMDGFQGPKDVFRNPEAIFRLFEGPAQMLQAVKDPKPWVPTADASPFLLSLGMKGDDFAVLGEHFKLGLYEHQSAGAIQGVLDLLANNASLLGAKDGTDAHIDRIDITAYEPAFGIIGDPAKKNPTTRQSADHSMAYIISTLLRKALAATEAGTPAGDLWKQLMLSPYDYSAEALANPTTRSLMHKIHFVHGGPEYDALYPDGIPTSLSVDLAKGERLDSGLVMYPAGHARNVEADLEGILAHKFGMMSGISAADDAGASDLVSRFQNMEAKSAGDVQSLFDFDIDYKGDFNDPSG